jgi:hypothetical protein
VIVFCGAVIVWAMTVAPVQVIGARDGHVLPGGTRRGGRFWRLQTVRYIYLGDKMTNPPLVNMPCDPVRRADGKCVVSVKMATALVVDATGHKHVVLRRRLRLESKK